MLICNEFKVLIAKKKIKIKIKRLQPLTKLHLTWSSIVWINTMPA